MFALILSVLAADLPPDLPPPDAGVVTPAQSFRDLSRFGLSRPSCPGDSACAVTEALVLVGAGDSNFGGFGLGFDVQLAFIAAESPLLRGKGDLDLWGHFNGLGTLSPSTARPPVGEVGAVANLGWGYVSPNTIRGGSGLVLLLDAASFTAGVFEGANFAAYTPNLEIGFLAHSATFSTSFAASLHLGGCGFYGDGLLTHADATGVLSHWAIDPYAAAEVRADLPLSPTTMLRLRAVLSLTPDWVVPGVERTLLSARFEALVRFGPLITGPTLMLFAPQTQLASEGGVTGAPPETTFLWLLGF